MKEIFKNNGVLPHSPLGVGGAGGIFLFESDFIADNIRCIPMIVRYKLDACGIKLTLKQWSKMSVEERNIVTEFDCDSAIKLNAYKTYLQQVIFKKSGEIAKEIDVEENPEWLQTLMIPAIVAEKSKEFNLEIAIQQWQELNILQRFVLVKLARPSHENRNFPLAAKEFGLVKHIGT